MLLEHRPPEAVSHILVKFWPPGRFSLLLYYIISVIMISATVIPKSSRLGPDKDLAITVLWAVQTKKKIKSLFSRLIRHISDEKCERWASRKKNNKKYKLVS